MSNILLVDTSAREDARVVATEVQKLVGLPMTAFLANLGSVVDLNGRLGKDDGFTDDGFRSRLQFVLDLAGQFRVFNASSRFKAWLREVDAQLGRMPPAVLIRHSYGPTTRARLSEAAERYLRGLPIHRDH